LRFFPPSQFTSASGFTRCKTSEYPKQPAPSNFARMKNRTQVGRSRAQRRRQHSHDLDGLPECGFFILANSMAPAVSDILKFCSGVKPLALVNCEGGKNASEAGKKRRSKN